MTTFELNGAPGAGAAPHKSDAFTAFFVMCLLFVLCVFFLLGSFGVISFLIFHILFI